MKMFTYDEGSSLNIEQISSLEVVPDEPNVLDLLLGKARKYRLELEAKNDDLIVLKKGMTKAEAMALHEAVLNALLVGSSFTLADAEAHTQLPVGV